MFCTLASLLATTGCNSGPASHYLCNALLFTSWSFMHFINCMRACVHHARNGRARLAPAAPGGAAPPRSLSAFPRSNSQRREMDSHGLRFRRRARYRVAFSCLRPAIKTDAAAESGSTTSRSHLWHGLHSVPVANALRPAALSFADEHRNSCAQCSRREPHVPQHAAQRPRTASLRNLNELHVRRVAYSFVFGTRPLHAPSHELHRSRNSRDLRRSGKVEPHHIQGG
jgi:hypothetical protein